VCETPGMVVFNTATSTFESSFPYLEFVQNCSSVLNAQLLQYNPIATYSYLSKHCCHPFMRCVWKVIWSDIGAGLLEFNVDMQSFMTAYAVNTGILSAGYLEVILPSSTISLSDLEFYYNGTKVRTHITITFWKI
jgi:hypothetical protein